MRRGLPPHVRMKDSFRTGGGFCIKPLLNPHRGQPGGFRLRATMLRLARLSACPRHRYRALALDAVRPGDLRGPCPERAHAIHRCGRVWRGPVRQPRSRIPRESPRLAPHPTSPADRVATTGTQKRSPEHIASRPKDLESRNSATLISVFIGRNGSDRDAEHRARGGPPDSICSGHRAPPTVIANSAVRAMSIMYVRCVSALGHIRSSLTCGYLFPV
jgi:hypothetical protein